MEMKWLQDFIALSERRNFSRAAEMRNVTQSAFSRRIRALEEWAGAELVDRSRYPVELTLAGRIFSDTAREVVYRLDAVQLELGGRAQRQSRVITFAAQHSLVFSFYPRWLKALEAELGPFPSRLRSDNLPNCVQDLVDGEVDFVICFHHPGIEGVIDAAKLPYVLLGGDRLIAVSAPDARGEPRFRLPGSREAPLPHLSFGSDAPIGWQIELLLRRAGNECFLTTRYENAVGESLRQMAIEGQGIAWLPESLVATDLDDRRLVHAGGADWSIEMAVRLHRSPVTDNPQVDLVWDLLQKRQGRPLVPVVRD